MAAPAVAALAVLLLALLLLHPSIAAEEGYGSILNTLTDDQAAKEPCPPWLAEYIKFHRENRGRPDTKYIIYTCNKDFPDKWNCGGLGDRLRGIKFCLKMAYVSNRVLLIDETKPVPLEANLMPNLIDWTMKGVSIDPESDSVARFSWIRHLVGEDNYTKMDFSAFYGNTQYIRVHTDFAYDTHIIDPPREVDQDHMTGHFFMSTGLEVPRPSLLRMSCLFRTLFTVHPTLRRHYTTALHRLFPAPHRHSQHPHPSPPSPTSGPPSHPPYIAIHFRAGGMATGELIRIQRSDDNLSSLMRSLACARRQATARNITAPILLLTDNAALRTAIQAGHLGADVTTTKHKAYHIDLSFDGTAHDVARAAARTVYVDLMLLAGSKCLVVPTRSGFNNEARMWAAHECFVSWAGDECFQLPVVDAMRAALNLPADW